MLMSFVQWPTVAYSIALLDLHLTFSICALPHD